MKAAIAILSNMLATFPSKNQRQSCCDQLLDLELFDSSPAMGWGGKGKGCWHRHHHHGGIGLGGAVAEAALIGTAAVAGAAVASAVAPRRPCPRAEVLVIPTPARLLERTGRGRGRSGTPVEEMPPLSVSAIGMPAAAIVQQGGVTYFGIEVMPETGATYRVQKRYQDFEVLKDSLARIAPRSMIDRGFPRKHMFSCEGAKLEERRRGLEQWLKGALNHPLGRLGWCLKLRDFLEVGQIHTLAYAQALQSNPSSFSAPSAPELLETSEGQPMQILVPHGVECGQTLAVTVPDGRQLTVTVPPGFPGGSELLLWFDADAGTLSPLV